MQIPLSPHVIHTYITIIERAYKIKEERKEGGEEGGGEGRCPHTLPIESTGQLDTHLVPHPSKHTQGLHTPLLPGHKGGSLPLFLRGLQARHTSTPTPTHTPTPYLTWRFSWTHPGSPHTLLAGHKGVPPPPARSTGSRHTSKSLTHTHP